MGSRDMEAGIEALRRAGLPPSRRRVMLAALACGGGAVSAAELRELALDDGLDVGLDEAEAALAEFRTAGMVPVEQGGPRDCARAVRLLQAMANPHRLAVLRELLAGERCVSDLLAVIGIGQSAMSQHLARLRADGLVTTRRASARIFYSLAAGEVAIVLRGLGQVGAIAA